MLTLVDRYPGTDPASLEPALLFLKTANELKSALEAHFARFDLSPGRFSILLALLQDPLTPLSPSELARRGSVTRATMTGLLDVLEKKALVIRLQSPGDRRASLVQLTDKGKELAEKLLPDHLRRMGELMQNFSEEDRKVFIQIFLNQMKSAVVTFAK